MRAHVTAVGAVILVVGCALLWTWRCDSEPQVAQQEGPGGATEERVTREPEAWMRDLARDGEALVRTPVAGGVVEKKFASLGPLSSRGIDLAVALVDEEVAKLEQEIDGDLSVASASDNESSANRYARDLRRIRRLELLRARRDQIRSGAYMTLPLQNSDPPPIPKDVSQWRAGPFPLEAGGQCLLIVWVDTGRRAGLSELDKAVREVVAEEADSALREFQSRPYEYRKKWVERFDILTKKMSLGVGVMGVDELTELSAMKRQVAHMRAQVDLGNFTLYRRTN